MATKTPVYWRTNDGRKVVIVKEGTVNAIVFDDKSGNIQTCLNEQLTPWVEPETRTVYVHWFKETKDIGICSSPSIHKDIYKAIKKLPIIEGEFDD